MTPSTTKFKAGTLVWVESDKIDLSQDEVGEVVSSSYRDYEDPRSGETNKDGVVIKLKISNTRQVFPARRLRLFDPETRNNNNNNKTTTDDDDDHAASTKPRRSTRKSSHEVTPSPVGSSSRYFVASETESETKTEESEKDTHKRKLATTTTTTETKRKSNNTAASKTKNGSSGVAKKARRSKKPPSEKSTLGAEGIGSDGTIVADKQTVLEKPAAPKRKPAAKQSSSRKKRKEPVPDEIGSSGTIAARTKSGDDDDDDDEPLISLKKPSAPKRKPAAKRSASKKPQAPKRKPAAKKPPSGTKKKAGGGMPLLAASESDSDDEKDRPFRVEYATTGRATCKGCDERIEKNILRVSSRPLFRGKPGFTVYRHLTCQTFPEEITRVEEVGGWRRLTPDDRALLAKQLDDSKLRIEEENQELDADELVQHAFQGTIREAPPGCAATLLPFQREGVSWMYNQERSDVSGGILADEMGMGKTLQTITTILDNRPKLQHAKPGAKHPPGTPDLEERVREEALWKTALKSCHYDLQMADVPKQVLSAKKKKKGADPIGVRGGTLVVCPLIALYQWKEEIQKFTDADALTVCIYHGNDRHEKFPREILSKYDVILTTYQVLEADFRKMVSPNKVKCPNCGRAFKMDKLGVHLKYFCGETAQRTAAQSRQRRSSDHPQHRRNRGGAAPGRGKGKPTTKPTGKKSFRTRTSPPITKTKRTARPGPTKGYDSDSEVSIPENFDVTSKRRSRAAAQTATKRMSASAKEWAGNDAGDSSDFSEVDDRSSSEEDDESADESFAPRCTIVPTNRKRGAATDHETDDDDDDDSLDSDSDDSEDEDRKALIRSRQRQRIALAAVKQRATKKGSTPAKKKGTPRTGKKKSFGKKRPLDSSSEDDDDDPLRGIDMDALREKAMQGCRASVLHTISWWRIVLDEAHNIKSRSSSTSSAAFHLTAIHRWCLSGTPLQNRVGELYSLIRFLRIDPMAHYFCRQKGVDCKSIYYRMEHGKCKNCGCASSQHYSYFNKHVLNVIQREGYTGDGRRAMMKLKNEVLDKCLLRRTKESRAEDMNLPPRFVTIKPIRLHPREEDFYNALYTQTKSSFDDYVQEGTLLNNYAHIFDLLTKMRQAVDHPYLIVYSKKNHTKLSPEGPAVANGSTLCELCGETPTDRVLSTCCRSAFCRSCVVDMLALADVGQGSTRCPCCRAPFSIDLNQASQAVVDNGTLTVNDTAGMPSLKEMRNVASGSILRRINLAEFSTSTKLESLVEELYAMRRERPGSKALVFSQFTSMLDLCRWRLVSDPCLQDLGLGVRIVHGGMNVQSRDEALKAFKDDPSVRVLLMSLKAGGVALNLTVANEAYLLDPWWNPAAEMQAIDRTHRLGQYRPIRAVRFIAEGTVEERVLQLQEKKRLVFDGTVGRDAASLKMLTVDDMKALFT